MRVRSHALPHDFLTSAQGAPFADQHRDAQFFGLGGVTFKDMTDPSGIGLGHERSVDDNVVPVRGIRLQGIEIPVCVYHFLDTRSTTPMLHP